MTDQDATAQVAALADDEHQMLSRIVGGWSLADIADEMGVGSSEAEDIRKRLFDRLNVKSTTGAFRIAVLAGLD